MADVKISALPTKAIASTDVVPVVDASFTTTSRVTAGDIAALGGGPPATHKASHATGGTDALTASDIGAQPADAELTAIAGLASAADRLPYFTGSGTAALATLTSVARTLLDDSTTATMRSTLGLAAVASSGSYADLTSKPTIPTLGSIWASS